VTDSPHTQLAREPLDVLVRWLDRAVVVTAVLAAVGLLLPGRAGLDVATAAITVVVAAPLLRIVWLVVAWARTGDRRFVAVGVALLLVISAGAVVALTT
jgi:hypothetical protein